MKFSSDIHGPQTMIPTDFYFNTTMRLVFWVKLLTNY